ncbi:CFI-box-CTERM domain-containing protein [Geomesophilobacter sediminis]|uniref:Fibronectin type-III domain-containing protein n=1 Tax=Geomesophilobacter sediminis TaxID=2798584 RepID=A0A8J7M351_9BACT|nr:CFI-box-CTERM domain-containing protein [Geomesophilobacter sediminis]MBJ6727879.1 hypothetical protein [Geomesophilobacter sediminis]
MLKRTHIILVAIFVVLASVAVPGAARATTTLTVSHTANSGDSNHFTTIQQAIDHVASVRASSVSPGDFLIEVAADATNQYTGAVLIDDSKTGGKGMSSVVIEGTSTKDTIVTSGSSSGVTFTISGNTSNITIRRFTFITGTGISISSSVTGTTISNNVFKVGSSSTAIQNASASTTITNNTFYLNGTAINTTASIAIKNNIFSSNTPAIAGSESAPSVLYNLFNPKANAGIPISQLDASNIPNNSTSSDPQFVDPGKDFHLQPGSPAIHAGDPTIKNPDQTISDMGAYGGPAAELNIPQVSGVSATATQQVDTTFSVTLTWTALTSNLVTAYRVHYGTASGSYTSSQDISGQSSSSFTLQNLTPTTVTSLAPPTITSITPANGALIVHWTAVAGATNYLVYWNEGADFTDASLPTTFKEVANVQTFTIPNLTNGATYFVRVIAKAQNAYFFAVGALAADGSEGPLSAEVSAPIGNSVMSLLSASVSQMPSTSVAYPYLKGEGCFIATAAYGFYSAWQVQALRDFRDRYLMTNGPGRAFVNWYYHYGPIGAHYLNQHPVWKPLVRVLLFPLVVGAIFLTATSSVTKVAVLALLLLATTVLFRRRAAVRWGGVR